MAQSIGKAPDTFSHELNNAQRKVILSAITAFFDTWVEAWEHKNGAIPKAEMAQLTFDKWGEHGADK